MQEYKSVGFTKEGLKAIQDRIENLRVDLGASGAILLNQQGELLVESGHRADLDPNAFMATLENVMSAMNAVVDLLDDEGAFDLHFHEGQTYDLHVARIDNRIFLTLIFQRHIGSSRVGMIWLSLRRTVTELRTLLKQAMVEPETAENKKIKSAVSDAFDQAIGHVDEDSFREASSPKTRRRRKFDFSAPAAPPQKLPASSSVSPDLLDDPKRVLTYDEARALGLINLDESTNERDS